MDGLSSQISSTLRDARIDSGLSVSALAELADISADVIEAIEAGNIYDHPYECITLAMLLRVDLGPIFGSEPDGDREEMRRTYHLLNNLVEVMRS